MTRPHNLSSQDPRDSECNCTFPEHCSQSSSSSSAMEQQPCPGPACPCRLAHAPELRLLDCPLTARPARPSLPHAHASPRPSPAHCQCSALARDILQSHHTDQTSVTSNPSCKYFNKTHEQSLATDTPSTPTTKSWSRILGRPSSPVGRAPRLPPPAAMMAALVTLLAVATATQDFHFPDARQGEDQYRVIYF